MSVKKSNEKKRLEWYSHSGTQEVRYADEDERPKTKCWVCGKRPCICNLTGGY